MVKPSAYSFRFDPELRAHLERLAKADGRTLANYIERVLWHHVEETKRDTKRK
jgi:predicted DNA-binding protein